MELKPIIKTNIKKIQPYFDLTIFYMHGDADADTEESFSCAHQSSMIGGEYCTLKTAILFIRRCEELGADHDAIETAKKDIFNYLNSNSKKELDKDDISDEFCNITVGDVTCDRQFSAAITGFSLHYYDDENRQHCVNITYSDGELNFIKNGV